jgi:alkaline phosphatase D
MSEGRRGQTRRSFLRRSAALGAGLVLPVGLAVPSLSRAADRPPVTHGVQSGDVSADAGVIWARTDRPAQMMVEVATSDSFRDARLLPPADALPESDYAAKLLLEELPSDQDIFYRIRFRDLADVNVVGEAVTGRFRTAPMARRDVSFVWGGDVVGQGWGINPEDGGMKTFAAMRAMRPDFFLHSGDAIYADGPLKPEVSVDSGLWKNLMIKEKAKVAETVAEFRANYKYNLLDEHLRAFAAEVPILLQWDDHEVTNNWSASKVLDERYRERSILALAARAGRAFHEMNPVRPNAAEPGRVYRRAGYGPMLDVFILDGRSYRAPNSANDQTEFGPGSHFLGSSQIAWLKRELLASRATWKVLACDMPLGLVVYDNGPAKTGSEAVAQGNGPPLGRELEIADLLRFIKSAGVRNTIWLTADVHYTAAHYYDPNRARFSDFDPFWEFVSGPLHAGTFGPNDLDDTFGPQLRFVKAPPAGQQNLPPSAGLQFFGHVAIGGATQQATVTLKDRGGADLWSITLDPKLG